MKSPTRLSGGCATAGVFLAALMVLLSPACLYAQQAKSWQQAVERIENHFEQGDYEQAVEVVEANEAYSGIPDFDMAAGRAYLFAGDPDRAARAFERVVIVDPQHLRGRLELGRALYKLGDYANSRDNFQIVLNNEPPEPVRQRAQRFLAAIERRMAEMRPVTDIWAALRGGHDSNVNTGSGNDFEKLLADFELVTPPHDTQLQDTFTEGAAGISHLTPWVDNRQWRFSGQAQHREHKEHSFLDLSLVQGGVSRVSRRSARTQIHLGGDLQQIHVDGEYLRTRVRLTPEWRRTLGPAEQMRLQPVLSYADYDNSDYNTWRVELGGAWLRLVAEELGSVFIARPAVHYEHTDADYLTRSGLNLDGTFMVPVNEWNTLTMGVSTGYLAFMDGAEQGESPRAFNLRDKDDSAERAFLLGINLSYSVDLPQEPWRITGMMTHREKYSNIDMRNYERSLFMVDFRYEWD